MVFSEMYCDAIDPPTTAMAVATACPKMAPVATPAAATPAHLFKLCRWHMLFNIQANASANIADALFAEGHDLTDAQSRLLL